MTQQRDINKIDKTILDNFYKLVHSQPNIRVTAASSTFKILNAMKKRQNGSFNENLNYCVDRLVTGLASSRALARRGYGTLLLEILNSNQISTDRLFTMAQQKFGHISRETQRDNLLGYFILISIVLQSGNYKRSKANTQCLEKMYKLLIQLHNIKSYLEYSVCKILVEYYHLFHSYMVADIPQQVFGSDSRISSTDLLIIILCNKKEPVRGLLSMDIASLTNLYSVLLDEKFQKRPLHPVFLEVGMFVMKHFPQQFQNFYTTILFPTFFKANHNELAAMGLELTASLMELTDDAGVIKVLLNDHIVRTLILSLRKRNSLHTHCVKFFNNLKEQFKNSDAEKSTTADKQYAILLKLTSSPGSIAFDDDSKSSSINDLLHNCSPKTLKKYLDSTLMVLQTKPDKDDHFHQSCARQISFIIRRPQMVEDQITMMKAAKFLLSNALDTTSVDQQNQQQSQLNFTKAASFKAAYHSTLDHIISVCNAAQRIEHLSELVNFSNELISSNNVDTDDGLLRLWSTYISSLSEHKKYDDFKQLYPITSLYLFYGLQVIEHRLDCKNSLEELAQASHDVIEGDPADGSWSDVLTDQIIAILSATECSAWIRNLCESVFGSLIPHISQTSIDLMCDAIREPLNEEDVDDSECGGENDNHDDEVENEGEEMSDSDSSMSVDDDQSQVEGDENSPESKDDDEDEDEGGSGDGAGQKNDDSDEEEGYLTDEQMMKYDSVIAEMFKTKKTKKADNSAFRLRCLDLVKKVLIKRPNDTEAVQAILATIIPLARKKSAISDKITTILSKMPNKSKYPNVVDFLEKKKGAGSKTTAASTVRIKKIKRV